MGFETALGDFGMIIRVRWLRDEFSDSFEMHTRLDGANANLAVPLLRKERETLQSKIKVPAIELVQSDGGGRLAALVEDVSVRSIRRVTEYFLLRRSAPLLDFALFALDHDGGHGLEAADAVSQLWTASPQAHEDYRQRTKALLNWAERKP